MVFAQDAPPEAGEENAGAPPRRVRVLPVGDPPPFRQEVRDGVRYELEPEKGAIPPRSIHLRLGEEAPKVVTLHLGRISEPVEVPVDLRRFVFREGDGQAAVGEGETGPVWLTVDMPERPDDVLMVLFRPPAPAGWDRPRLVLLSDGWEQFKAGDLRVLNLAPLAVAVGVGDERLQVRSGGAVLRSPGAVDGLPLELAHQAKEVGWQRFHRAVLVQNEGERTHLVIYRADGEKPRRPLQVLMFRERRR